MMLLVVSLKTCVVCSSTMKAAPQVSFSSCLLGTMSKIHGMFNTRYLSSISGKLQRQWKYTEVIWEFFWTTLPGNSKRFFSCLLLRFLLAGFSCLEEILSGKMQELHLNHICIFIQKLKCFIGLIRYLINSISVQ